MTELANLFSPISINSLELENRAVMPAMGTGYGGTDGSVTDRLLAYLSRRARGGAGLIITEICAVDTRGKGMSNEIGAWSDDLVASLAKIPVAVHGEGGKVALQLHHAGRETMEAFAGAAPEAPSPIPSPIMLQPCEEMSLERITEVVLAYGSAAARAVEAGFDAVEIHGAHGYLINQFLSPFSNQRTDEYGGSDENRARFALAVAAAVREAVGPDFPIIFRVSSEELVRGGYDLSFMKWLAPRLVEAGADSIHASVGVIATPGGYTIASMDIEPGFNLPRARELKQVVGVPVIAVGRISDPRLADEAIEHGDADMVSFGRQHLTDPDFLARARRGDFEHIRWCLACNQGCIERLSYEFKAVTCTINPECGREYEGQPARVENPLRVWVIGAGPAGLSAALSASERGHMVEVFERDASPGGQLKPASRTLNKQGLADWVDWATRQLGERGVEVKLGADITADDIRDALPDHVILASGATPAIPDIPGSESDRVFDARKVLLSEVALAGEVVVLGAGYVGMETADFLVSQGAGVTILEMSPAPPIGKHTAHGYWLHRRLKEAGATLLLGARVARIEPDAIYFVRDGAGERLAHAGPVVTALGATPESALTKALERAGIPFSIVGDADSPRRLIEAVHEGHAAGAAV